MRRMADWARVGASSLSLFAVGAGCTFINTFADVAPQKVGDDASTPDSSVEASADAPADGGPGSDADAPFDAAPRGAIVVGGAATVDGGDQLVLTALDPGTGTELPNARVEMTVSAVQYDGARDLWYVFESGGQGIFPLPTDPFYLHVRKLDTYTGDWTEVGKMQIPPGLSFATTAVLGERVSYIAYGQGSDAGAGDGGLEGGAEGGTSDGGIPAAFGLVTINTSDPTNMTIASIVDLSTSPVAVVGSRSGTNAAGGFATLGATTSTSPRVAQLTPVLLPATDVPSVEAPIVGTASVGGQVGFAGVRIGGVENVAVVSRGFGSSTTPATVQIFNPASSDPTQALVGEGTFTFGDGNIKAPAFSECAQTIFVVGTNADLNLYAVPIGPALMAASGDGGLPQLPGVSAPTSHSGQGVYFEPFTNTVLTPFSQGSNYALTAFSFDMTGGTPHLVQRQAPQWVPPSDLRPNFVATRTPIPFTCPVDADP